MIRSDRIYFKRLYPSFSSGPTAQPPSPSPFRFWPFTATPWTSYLSKPPLPSLSFLLSSRIPPSGFPPEHRLTLWSRLLGNPLRVTKSLFSHLIDQCLLLPPSPSIRKDLSRTFPHFPHPSLRSEAYLLLRAFSLFRPDMGYVQGMAYLMVFLLGLSRPYRAFKLFCGLVMGDSPLFSLFSFKQKEIDRVNSEMRSLMERESPRLFSELEKRGTGVWNVLWVEWMYGMFLRTFDVESCLVLWDLAIVRRKFFIYQISCCAFRALERDVLTFDLDHAFEHIKTCLVTQVHAITQDALLMKDAHWDPDYQLKLNQKRADMAFHSHF